MQPTLPPPPPDLPPAPPELPPELPPEISAPVVQVDMVQIPVSSIPRSAEQLQGMRVRAEEIQNQLEQDLTTTNRLVTAATPEAHAQWQAQEHAREARRGDDDEAEMFFVGGGAGILLALFAVAVRRRFRRGRDVRPPGGTVSTADDPRIDRLGQAVDAIALEVERIGEGQRFVTQLLAEERDPRRLVGARPEDAMGQPRR
jgi:hypothetical protein